MYLESMGYVSFVIERIDELIQGSKEKHILEYGQMWGSCSPPNLDGLSLALSAPIVVAKGSF